jgi:glycosyltransferase involved in cell wall biosynthesis
LGIKQLIPIFLNGRMMIRYDVLIPAYNAENTIFELLLQISTLVQPPENIIVVDDGSQDKTAQICEDLNVQVIRNVKNQGKGYTLKVGFQSFLEDPSINYVLCMDADLQHPVSSVPSFLSTAETSDSKFVVGVRKNRLKSMPLHRVVSNLLTSSIISLFCGQRIKDSQCGLRLIHRDVLKKITLYENGYQLESEMILKAARESIVIDWVSIPTIYNGEKSYIGNISDTFRFMYLIYRELRDRLRWFMRSK